MDQATKPDRLIRSTEVLDRTALSRTSIYRMVRRGEFPAPVNSVGRRIAWRERDVAEWIDRKAAEAAQG